MVDKDYALAWQFVDSEGKPRQMRFRMNFAPAGDPRIFDGTGQLVATIADANRPDNLHEIPLSRPHVNEDDVDTAIDGWEDWHCCTRRTTASTAGSASTPSKPASTPPASESTPTHRATPSFTDKGSVWPTARRTPFFVRPTMAPRARAPARASYLPVGCSAPAARMPACGGRVRSPSPLTVSRGRSLIGRGPDRSTHADAELRRPSDLFGPIKLAAARGPKTLLRAASPLRG
jgi:hypothetical protein